MYTLMFSAHFVQIHHYVTCVVCVYFQDPYESEEGHAEDSGQVPALILVPLKSTFFFSSKFLKILEVILAVMQA